MEDSKIFVQARPLQPNGIPRSSFEQCHWLVWEKKPPKFGSRSDREMGFLREMRIMGSAHHPVPYNFVLGHKKVENTPNLPWQKGLGTHPGMLQMRMVPIGIGEKPQTGEKRGGGRGGKEKGK